MAGRSFLARWIKKHALFLLGFVELSDSLTARPKVKLLTVRQLACHLNRFCFLRLFWLLDPVKELVAEASSSAAGVSPAYQPFVGLSALATSYLAVHSEKQNCQLCFGMFLSTLPAPFVGIWLRQNKLHSHNWPLGVFNTGRAFPTQSTSWNFDWNEFS